MRQVGETEISGEEEINYTIVSSEFQTVIKAEPNGIIGLRKRHILKYTVIFAMHVHVSVVS